MLTPSQDSAVSRAANEKDLGSTVEAALPEAVIGPTSHGEGERGPVSRFSRNKTGSVVHFTSCRVPGERVPWRWADDKSDHIVAWTILNTRWLRPCKRCCGVLADAL